MMERSPRLRNHRVLAVAAVSALLLVGCSAPEKPSGPPAAPAPGADHAASDSDIEREAMDCVTGAWEASTSALQALFDQAIAESDLGGYRIIVDGTIVYEFLSSGFGVEVIPTAFTMTMPTAVGDVTGEINGRASAVVWTVKGEFVHVSGEAWQNMLTTRWTFAGETIEADTGAQSMVEGLTDIDYFTCKGDELILKSLDGPPLTLTRMSEVK